MRMYGYGEDGLTYRALTDRLGEVLTDLEDTTGPEDAVVFYRPSFGRKAGSRLGTAVSQFGEFDAIVGTSAGVYLVEAKWSRSQEMWRPEMKLRHEQLRRHGIFRWILERWWTLNTTDWEEYRSAARPDFEAAFPGFTIAAGGTQVAKNLAFVLKHLRSCGRRVEDVLLYNSVDDDVVFPPFPQAGSFRTVKLKFGAADTSGFYIFGASQDEPPPRA